MDSPATPESTAPEAGEGFRRRHLSQRRSNLAGAKTVLQHSPERNRLEFRGCADSHWAWVIEREAPLNREMCHSFNSNNRQLKTGSSYLSHWACDSCLSLYLELKATLGELIYQHNKALKVRSDHKTFPGIFRSIN
ncbi:uncharacterized protein PGTG_18768 [Puccinia graminis f. sp. tritici CRL 75-36-700-3]|uniref:Uncharacterized protein n=1 Tax=Puccinia graminis f. sp. tritici (strain CRL 75-36-700-3 / race SCCL) TaxID=418459 RepID=E3L874_PUCGT|nr:uncharacterized protein PGTG_18768 [Puccinia graminis f. sp. tritici CRL 75-36-700-3]EFP92749.1 hypothetical protein PGTG_18768 [Puccinia graminis f. sp. tritici CRL 75-36-700-3]